MKLDGIRRAAFVTAFVAALVPACSTSVDPTNPFDPSASSEKQAKGTVRGTIDLERSDDEGGAMVSLEGTSLTAMTTSDGSFALTNVKPGTYALLVAKEGFKQERVQGLTVAVGAEIDLGKIAVAVARGVVSGAVSLAGLSDFSGTTVSLSETASQQPSALSSQLSALSLQPSAAPPPPDGAVFAAVTGSDGNWQISDVPAGQYFVVVSKEGFQGTCAGMVTIIVDGERKSVGTLTLNSASVLVKFAKSSGAELTGYEENGRVLFFTNDASPVAHFTASGAVKMRAAWSETEIEALSFESFAVEKAVPLAPGEAGGEKTLLVDLQDQCGLSRRYSASLTLDTKAPEGARADMDALEGLDGKKYVTSSAGQVTVRLSADDSGSGVREFRRAVDSEVSAAVYEQMPGSGALSQPLGQVEKEYTVNVQYRDRAGNESEVVSAVGVVDYTAPVPGTPPVVVTNGISDGTKTVVYDDNALLSFDLPAVDAAQIALGFASGSGAWEQFVPEKALDVRGRARGDVAVFVKFRDNAKNETQEYSAAFFRETLGSVSGTVSLESAGAVQAPQVTISVEGVTGVSTVADAQGAYTLPGVPGGARVLKATASGYVAATVPVSVVPGPQAVPAPPMTLAAARGIIRGQVTLDGGGAAAGAQVSVRGTGALGTAVASGTVAGSDGRYEIAGLLSGTDYDLSASKDGYKLKTGARVDVKEGAVTDNVALVLELDPGSITGKVLLEGGGSASACTVSIAGGTPVNPEGTGAFTIANLEQGTYTVTFKNTGFDEASQVAVVKAGTATTLSDVTLRKSRGTLSGLFTLSGAQSHSGISVKVAEAGLSVETKADGSFTVQNLVAQQYTVSASMYGYTAITGQTVTVPAGGVGTAAGGALAVALSASISGTASCDVGSCANAAVALNGTRFDGNTASTSANADGSGVWSLQNLAAGEYTVTVSKTGYKSGQAALSVAPAAAKSAGTILLSAERGSIAGTVTAGGTAKEGAVLTLSGTSSIGITVSETTTSGSGGAFRFGSVLAGSYTLTAALADFSPVSQGVAVASAAETNAGAINLAVNPGSVTGSVTLEGGSPGAGVTVSVEGGGASTVTTGAGAYTLSGVTPGSRALLFTKGNDYEQYRLGGVEVPAGGSATAPSVTLLRARGSITGTVVLVGGADPTGVTVMVEGGQAVTSADSSGDFRLERVPVGSNYTVTAIEEGYVRATKTGVNVSAGMDTDAGTLSLAKLVGDFDINDGSGVAGDRAVTLDLSTLNNPAFVRASEDVTFSGGAQAYEAWQASYPFTITSAGDGTKTVFMQYKDTGDQEHGPFSASVLLDTTDPVVNAVIINDGAARSNSKIVGVSIDATDGAEGSGIVSMQMRNDDQFNDGDPWPDYEIDVNTWTLADPTVNIDLDKDVWVRLRDAAGNIGAAVKGTIRLDTLAPTGTLTLNGGDEWTTSTQVTATVSGASADVDSMALSNVMGGTTVFTSFQTDSTWFITPGDSATAKPVYLRLKDAAGNYSLETNDGIKLDETPPPVPSIPVTSALTNDTTPSINFGGVADNVSSVTYDVELSDQSDFSNLMAVTLVGTTVTASSALSDGEYYFHVRALDAAGNASQFSTAAAFTVDSTGPAAPENLSGPASPTNNLRPTLSWDAVTDAVSYRVERSLDPAFLVGVLSSVVTTTSWRPGQNLQDNATINWRVFAIDAAGNESLPSTASSFATDATPPGVPVLSSPADGAVVSTASVTLTWQAAAGATSYRVQAATDSGFYSVVLSFTLAALSVETSPADGTYYWHVLANDDAGNASNYSATRSVTKDTTPPNIPIPQSPANEARSTKKRPVLQWSDESASGAASYIVSIRDKNGNLVFDPAPETAGNSFTPTQDLPDAASPFTWSVRSKDSRGNTSQASTLFTFTVDTTGPTAPVVTRTSPDGDIDPNNNRKLRTPPLVFLWPKVTVASPDTDVTYHLEVVDNGGTTLIDQWGIPQPSSGSSVSYATTSAGITSATYCWHVQAVDDLGNKGAFSSDFDAGSNKCTGPGSTAAIFEIDNTAPSSPEPLIPTPYSYVTTLLPQFMWIPEAGSGADKYELRIYNVTDGGVHLVKEVGPPGTLGDYTLQAGEALTNGKTYAFAMVAVDSVNNRSEESSRNQFTVDTSDPLDPQNLTVNGMAADPAYVNTASPSLSWANGGSTDIDHFELKIKTDNQCNGLLNIVQAAGVTSNAFLAAALNDGTYYWCVRAVDRADRTSAWVLGNRIVLDTVPPPSPRFNSVSQTILDLGGNAACGLDNQFSIGLSVTSGSDPSFDHYEIRGGHSAAGGAPCAQLAEFTQWPGGLPFVFNLNADAVNTLQVRAVDKAGNASDADFVIITEDSTSPAPPSNIVVTEGNGRTFISWTASPDTDVAGYKLYYGPSSSPPYIGAFAPEGISPINVGNVTSFGLSSLANNAMFYVTVTAYDRTQSPGPHDSIMPAAKYVLPNPVTPEPVSTYNSYTLNPSANSVALSGSNALIADSSGKMLEIVDVSNPASPLHKGSVTFASGAYRVVVQGSVAYVVEGDNLTLVNIRDPANPSVITSYDPPGCSFGLYDIFIQGSYVYGACGDDGLLVIDVSDPLNPVQTDVYDSPGSARAVFVFGGYAYLADGPQGLRIVNVNNPADILAVGFVDTPGNASGVFVSRPYAYVADETAGLQIIDVWSAAFPSLAGSYQTPGNAQAVRVEGNLAYVADGPEGVTVLDVGNPIQPVMLGSFDTAQAAGLAISGTHLYVADQWDGLVTQAVATATAPVQRSARAAYTDDLTVSGTFAYVSDRDDYKLKVVLISDRANPTETGSVALGDAAFGVAVQGRYAYVAATSAGLKIIDVANYQNPVVVGTCPTAGAAFGVAVSGKYAGAAHGSGFSVVNVSNPVAPFVVDSSSPGGAARDVVVAGKYAYVIFDDALRIFEVAPNGTLTARGSWATGGQGTGVAVGGDFAYVTSTFAPNLFAVVDVADVDNPVLRGGYSNLDQPQAVFVSGKFAYVADNANGLRVLDVSTPSSPALKAAYNTAGWAYGVFVSGTNAYVADDYAGMKIIDLEP